MSQPDGYAARLGQPADWGLTPDSFAPLRDELADHLHCIDEDGRTDALAGHSGAGDSGTGIGSADTPVCDPSEIAARLASPKARRALTATRIADQVYATLHRWPNREEWRELKWLLVWFGFVLLSDYFAHEYLVKLADPHVRLLNSDQLMVQSYVSWALQGMSRAGFFTLFLVSLWRAYRSGNGVLIARVLQLKLIHTVLVVGAFYSVGQYVFNYYWNVQGSNWIPAPKTIFTAVVISGFLGFTALLVYFASKKKIWQPAVYIALLAVFLYSGGPVNYKVIEVSQPIVFKKNFDPRTGAIIRVPETDRAAIQERRDRLESIPGWKTHLGSYDFENNSHTWRASRFPLIWGSFFSHEDWQRMRRYKQVENQLPASWNEKEIASRSATPISFGGAGLGWLAAPIPFLGIFGLMAMMLIMGRRDFVSLVAYGMLCFIAIVSTILPFVATQQLGNVIWFNSLGMVLGPFPGFDALFVGGYFEEDWMLILGLVLSAALPWLLTALFLKPTSRRQPQHGPEVAA